MLASGEDVNILVFDTEVYSNTGGQASKASQIGQVAQFAAAGKAIKKKDLAAIAMTYGYVYVAQIAHGRRLRSRPSSALVEAESYNGPSLVIGYAPCDRRTASRAAWATARLEIKAAVEAGYWHLFRYDPRLKAEGKNPFTAGQQGSEGRLRRLHQERSPLHCPGPLLPGEGGRHVSAGC